jgi:acyl-coenzyme A synthetase/AMP-(fatty) acid ligase
MNTIQLIAEYAKKNPNARALVYGKNSCITYSELIKLIHRAAAVLSQHRPGTHVGLFMQDTVQQVIIRLASMQVGVIAVPFTPKFSKEEFDRRAGLFDLKTIYADAEYSDHLAGYHVTCVDDFDRVFPNAQYTQYYQQNNDPISLGWSGGTQSTPNGLYYSHNSHRATANDANERWKMTPGQEVVYPVVPHISGAFVLFLIIALAHGHAMVIESQPFSPSVVTNNIVNHKVTCVMGIPTVFSTLLRRALLPKNHVPRLCVASGDAVSVKIQQGWQNHYGVRLIALLAACQLGGGFCQQEEYHPINSTGTPWSGFEVRLLDDQGNEVPDGQVGQLWARGANCAVADISVDGTTSFGPDGWVTTNDMLLRLNGVYFVVGRKNDTFKVNGQFVNVLKVEDCVREIPGVADAVAVPFFNNAGLSQVKVYVVPEKNIEDVEPIKHTVIRMHKNLYAHERPGDVEIIDEIPRHQFSMKVQRFKLNPLYMQNVVS